MPTLFLPEPGVMLATAATNTFLTAPALNVFAVAGGAGAWSYSGSADFTRSGAVLTYVGATPRRYCVRAHVSMRIAAVNAVLGLGISYNGDLNGVAVGAAAELAAAAQYQNQVTTGGTVHVTTERVLVLTSGNTLQLVGSTATGAVAISIDRAQLLAAAAQLAA